MIGPKSVQLSSAEEAAAYTLATERDGDRCVFMAWDCAGGVQRDHRKNRSQGGRTTPENLQCLCAKHHDWKTSHPKDAVERGYAVPGWADPAQYPAARWFKDGPVLRLGWCLYRPDGTVHEIPEAEARARMEGLW